MNAQEFLSAYQKLKLSIPRVALINTNSENSEFTSYAIGNKNVYICMGCDNNEDCYYGYWIYDNKDATDCSFLYNTEIAYECIDVRRCYNIFYSQDCTDCRDLFLCFDCLGSNDCFGCVGLRKKEFHIFNEPFSRDEYKKRVAAMRNEWKTAQGQARIREHFETLQLKTPRVYMRQLNNENCTGDYIYNSRNCLTSFDVRNSEDSQYLYNVFDCKNCSDCSYAKEGELLYECVSAFGNNFNFCYICWAGSNLDFCELCFNCADCLGCIGLKNKSFHILNQPYSKEEYRTLASKIKSELQKSGWYSGKLPAVFC